MTDNSWQTDPDLLALMAELQGADTEDERIAKVQEWANALRARGMEGQGNSTATMYGQTASVPSGWAGVASGLGQGFLGGYQSGQAQKQQRIANANRTDMINRFANRAQHNADPLAAFKGTPEDVAPITFDPSTIQMPTPDLTQQTAAHVGGRPRQRVQQPDPYQMQEPDPLWPDLMSRYRR